MHQCDLRHGVLHQCDLRQGVLHQGKMHRGDFALRRVFVGWEGVMHPPLHTPHPSPAAHEKDNTKKKTHTFFLVARASCARAIYTSVIYARVIYAGVFCARARCTGVFIGLVGEGRGRCRCVREAR